MERSHNVVEDGEAVGDAGLSERVEEVEKGNVKGVGGVRESFENFGGPVGVHLDGTNEEIETGGESSVPGAIIREVLFDSCFEGVDGLFSKGCSHGLSKAREM